MSGRALLEARALVAMSKGGMLPLSRPDRLRRVAGAMRSYGPFGGSVRAAAIQHHDRTAITDERGEITYGQVDERIVRLANAFRATSAAGATVGILCRNHRQPLIAAWAASRAGMNTVWLNTAFSARQTQEVCAREQVDFLVCDADLLDRVQDLAVDVIVTDITTASDGLDALIAQGRLKDPPRPAKPGRLVLLTSGTTGTPKGAPRTEPRGYSLPGGLLDRLPMRSRETVVIGPPLFHGTGLIMTSLAIGLGSNVVLRRSFDPAVFLDDIVTLAAAAACVVPVMLQRVLTLDPERLAAADTSALRVVFSSGSALSAAVSADFHRYFGDVIYNVYGSTEVSVGTIATPRDVREAPTSVGRPVLGSRVAILDESGRAVSQGIRGRIFVGSVTPFEGYTGGGSKEVVDGMLSTGDIGHFDECGRLLIDGRDDDMIVSGGENVFPAEIEELLVGHNAVLEVAVVGATDRDFGARLRAFVVLRDGEQLSEESVKDYVRQNLARYKVPRDVVFLEELPRNPTGKIIKRELIHWTPPGRTTT